MFNKCYLPTVASFLTFDFFGLVSDFTSHLASRFISLRKKVMFLNLI